MFYKILTNNTYYKSLKFFIFAQEQDVPTTLMRSRADLGRTEEFSSIRNNDIVVNKVIQIFTELRSGKGRDKKKKKGFCDIDTIFISVAYIINDEKLDTSAS